MDIVKLTVIVIPKLLITHRISCYPKGMRNYCINLGWD